MLVSYLFGPVFMVLENMHSKVPHNFLLSLYHNTHTVKKKKKNYSIWSKKGDRSVKRVKSYSKWSENLLLRVRVLLHFSKILLFLQSDPLFYSIFFTVQLQLTFKDK